MAHMVAAVNEEDLSFSHMRSIGWCDPSAQATMNHAHIRGLATGTSSIRRGPASL